MRAEKRRTALSGSIGISWLRTATLLRQAGSRLPLPDETRDNQTAYPVTALRRLL
jgi:hypothetical protein